MTKSRSEYEDAQESQEESYDPESLLKSNSPEESNCGLVKSQQRNIVQMTINTTLITIQVNIRSIRMHDNDYNGELIGQLEKVQMIFVYQILAHYVIDLLFFIYKERYYFYPKRDEHGDIVAVEARTTAQEMLHSINNLILLYGIVITCKYFYTTW